MAALPWTAILSFGAEIIDELWETDEEKAQAKARLIALQQQGKLQELQTRLSAINSEAQSADPWTSRARPSFMYVIYALILFSIPMGFITAFSPETATAVTDGFKAWLGAIPTDLYTLFGIGYLGYAGARSWDKKNGVTK